MTSSFEILPFGKGELEARELPEHVWLTVTASPTHALDDTVDVAGRLRALGHTVTAHLAARMVRSRVHLDDVLAALAEAGVEDAFVVGGDATPPEGPYPSALELLSFVVDHPQRPQTIGIAGYPERHPLVDDATLAEALATKSRVADYIATQLCYDANVLVEWVHSIRENGIDLPVHVSVPGMVDRRRLLEISARVGVGPSLRYLRKQGGIRNLFRLSKSSADRLVDALEPRMDDPELNIAGFHYVTLNRLLDTWHWQEQRRTRHGAVNYDRSQTISSRGGTTMSYPSLEAKLQAVGDPVAMARNSQIGPYVYPGVPSEYSNWMDEQVAWRETSALFDQTHHMTDLYLEGPDVVPLFSSLGINTFENFQVGKAKQFVACNHDGYVIGDAILFFLDESRVNLVGRPSAHNWVQYHAETGDFDVTIDRDERTAANPTGRRKIYRFQVQGPTALDVLAKANGSPLPEIRFFNLGEITIAGKKVRALHHGMSGVPGLELFGPWEDMEDVRAAIVDAGKDFGLRQVGSRVYATNTLESGWIPCPLPAIFTGEEMKAYREWLPSEGYEGTGSLGGSYYTDDISDYYATPHELGYWPFVKFDHDFVGREALEAMGDEPKRRKVTLAWNGEDVAQAMGSLFVKGEAVKYINLPLSNYATWPHDKLLHDGELVGISTFSGYSYNERSMLSLGYVDVAVPLGAELTLVWGEEGGGSSKPVVERHGQAEIRAVVSPCPYSEVARTSYAEGWRTKAGVA